MGIDAVIHGFFYKRPGENERYCIAQTSQNLPPHIVKSHTIYSYTVRAKCSHIPEQL